MQHAFCQGSIGRDIGEAQPVFQGVFAGFLQADVIRIVGPIRKLVITNDVICPNKLQPHPTTERVNTGHTQVSYPQIEHGHQQRADICFISEHCPHCPVRFSSGGENWRNLLIKQRLLYA